MVVDGLAKKLSSAIFVLLIAALAVMALTLSLVFRPPLRLLPLAVALVAAAITFGLLAAVGGSLTMASIAVLPILIGLAVDYAIQFQARFNERATGLVAGAGGGRGGRAGGPVIGTAALATAAGFLVLLLSPIPMIRGFGVLLVAGVAIAFVARAHRRVRRALAHRPARAPVTRAASGRFAKVRAGPGTRPGRGWGDRAPGAGDLGRRARTGAGGRARARRRRLGRRDAGGGDLRPARTRPERPAASCRTSTSSRRPPACRARSRSPCAPTTSPTPRWSPGWATSSSACSPARDSGARTPTCASRTRSCARSSTSPDSSAQPAADEPRSVQGILDLLPKYFLAAFVDRDSPDSQSGTLVIPFGIKVMPFDEQKQLIDSIRSEIDPPGTENDPPAGVSAEVVGLPVLAADANSALSSNRYLLTLAGLAAVALALLAIYRSARRALVPLIPIVLATGWASLGLAIAGVSLNPMSATLGALVIAIATEFSVLLAARYDEERLPGVTVGEALRRAYARTGMAVVASGVTAIAGFAALTATDIRMLRDFGLVTVLDLGVALIGVLLVLPAALVWAETGFARLGSLPRRRAGAHPAPDAG